MKALEQRLTFLTLGVNNLQQVRDFYVNQFGWTPWKEEAAIVFFRLNGFILSLYPHHELAKDAQVAESNIGNSPYKGFTMAYNVDSEAEVDAVMELLSSRGVTIVKPAQKVFWGGYSGYVADVEGNLWEIAFNPFLEQ